MQLALVLCLFVCLISAESSNQKHPGDEVPLRVIGVGNEERIRPFYWVPWCVPAGVHEEERRHEHSGEGLDSGISFYFQMDIASTLVCNQNLTKRDVSRLQYSINNNYQFHMELDGLSFSAPVGFWIQTDESFVVFTHRKYIVTYNNDKIVGVVLTQQKAIAIEVGRAIELKYEVVWEPTDYPRLEYVKDPFQSPVMIVVFLVVVMLIAKEIFRRLKYRPTYNSNMLYV